MQSEVTIQYDRRVSVLNFTG